MVRVNDRYGINVEEYEYTVVQILTAGEKSKKKGEEYTRTMGYYSTFTGAIKAIDKYMVRDALAERDMSLDEAVRAIREVNNELLRNLGTVDMVDMIDMIEMKTTDDYRTEI